MSKYKNKFNKMCLNSFILYKNIPKKAKNNIILGMQKSQNNILFQSVKHETNLYFTSDIL